MPRFLKTAFVMLLLWSLTGLYIVSGNERAVVRRFGRAVTGPDHAILLKTSGLYFDWPWPLSQVDRVNLNEVRTLSVPVSAQDPEDQTQLLADGVLGDSTFLTGDKNLLVVRLTVHYRIAERDVGKFLFGSVALEDRLSCLVESVTADLLAQSGVDFVQVSGLSELRRDLTRNLQSQANRHELGLLIEEVILDETSPPVQVKPDFLDVANARADREQSLQAALSTAQQRTYSAQAEAREIRDAASSQAQQTMQTAEGSAGRFLQIIAPFQNPQSPGAFPQSLARRLALEQHYFQTVSEILEKIQGQVFLDTGQPLDLTIWRSLPTRKLETKSASDDPMPMSASPNSRD